MTRGEVRASLSAANSWSELVSKIQDIPADQVHGPTVDLVYRSLQRVEGSADIRIAYLSDHTLDSLSRHVSVQAARAGLRVENYLAPYDQHFQEVLDPNSGLAAFRPNLIFLSVSLSYLAPNLVHAFLDLSAEDRKAEILNVVDHLRSWADVALDRSKGMLVISNFPRPSYPAASIADGSMEFGEAEFYAELNLSLLREFRAERRVSVLDLDLVLARVGRRHAANARLAYLAKIPWAEAALPEMANEVLRHVRATLGQARKCLVLDLDNTLWGGVLGEDGVWGIQVGDSNGVARAFADFQRVIKSMARRGVILAVCSKNNHGDVVELFETRQDMPLQLRDFAALRINWEHKHVNLQSIAEELNIGLESLVFVDDNPVECEMVRDCLPQVQTILLPTDPAERPELLRQLGSFEKFHITSDDINKTAQYRDNAARNASMHASGDLTGFLESLETRLLIEPASERHVPRIHQLFSKTNQFNVTTRRYSVAEIEAFISDPGCHFRVATVSDRFGALGLIALYLIRLDGSIGYIDSFLMSCRAMGRGIETALINELKRELLVDGQLQVLEGHYLPTKKNVPARRFFDSQGFTLINEDDEGNRMYRLDKNGAERLDCPGIMMSVREDACETN